MKKYWKIFVTIVYILFISSLIWLYLNDNLNAITLVFSVIVISFVLFVLIYLLYYDILNTDQSEATENRIEKAIGECSEDSSARAIIIESRQKLFDFVKLTKRQLSIGFVLGLFLIAVGMIFIGYIIFYPVRAEAKESFGSIEIIAGVITQFLGATIIVFYRIVNSTAIEIFRELSKINSVGIAWEQALQISDDSSKNKTLQELSICITKGKRNE